MTSILYDGEKHVCLLTYPSIRDRLILLNGWSKTYAMTGWRLGYAVWPGKLYDYARKLAVNLHSCVNAPTQYAGLAALTGPQDAVEQMVAEFDKRRKRRGRRPQQAARRLLHHAQGRVLCFPQYQQTGWKAKPLANALLDETGVALIGGPGFRHPGRRLSAPVLRQFDRKHPAGARPHGRLSSQPESRVGTFCSAAGRASAHLSRLRGRSDAKRPGGGKPTAATNPVAHLPAPPQPSPANGGGSARPRWSTARRSGYGRAVLLVGHGFEPFHRRAVERLLHGDVHHRAVGTGAVPVLFAGRNPHRISGLMARIGPSQRCTSPCPATT